MENHYDVIAAGSAAEGFATFLWISAIVGMIAFLGGGTMIAHERVRLHDPYRDRDGAEYGPIVLGGGLFVTCISLLGQGVMQRLGGTEPHTPNLSPGDPPPAPDAPAPPVADSAPDVPLDWTPLVWIVVAVLAGALAAYLITRTRSHVIDRRNAKKALEADYAAAHAVYSEVADAYAAYLADPYAIFVRPLLDDLTEPRTAAFIDAFAAMNNLRPEQCPDTAERVQAFATAAQKARTAWRSADGYARTIGLRVTEEQDKRTVRRIHSALELALDTSATGQERRTALDTVERLAAGLVTIPDRIYDSAKTAIETTTRKQLTS